MPTPRIGGLGGLASAIDKGTAEGMKIAEAAETIMDPQASLEAKRDAAVETVKTFTKFAKTALPDIKVPKSNAKSLQESTSMSNINALSVKPNPLEINYSPDIKNTVYTETDRSPTYQFSSPLYITQIDYQLPSDQADVKNFFNNVLVPNLQSRVQASVSFNALAGTIFTASNLSEYFTLIMKALGTYYFYANTIAYCTDRNNMNTGMYALRDKITPEDMLLLQRLEERLNGMPIPKTLNEQAYWLFNNYKSTNDIPNSAMLKFSNVPFSPTVGEDSDGS